MGPTKWRPKPGKRCGARRVGSPKFSRFFFPSLPTPPSLSHFRSFFHSCGSSRGIWPQVAAVDHPKCAFGPGSFCVSPRLTQESRDESESTCGPYWAPKPVNSNGISFDTLKNIDDSWRAPREPTRVPPRLPFTPQSS